MYLIINSKKLIAEIAEHPSYVRQQTNGVIITCDKEHADAIYSNDSDAFYPIEKAGYLCESHTLIEVDSVPENVVAGYYFYHAGEFYITEENQIALDKERSAESLIEENEQLKTQVAELEEELTNAQLALCDVYEILAGGEVNG